MQRDGDEDVYVVECRVLCEGAPHLSSHDDGEVLVAVIFYLVQKLLGTVLLLEDEEGCGGFLRDAAAKTTRDEIVTPVSTQSFRKVIKAMKADFLFIIHQRFAADTAGAREEEVDEVTEYSKCHVVLA